jgi:cation:H+ antiporter
MLAALFAALLGLAVLIAGAELLTRGGAAIAARFGVPPILIGLTIVALGTSAPELAVGIESGLQGNGALAVGNIAGTNTVNLLLILGLSALLRPLPIEMQTLRLDLPAMVLAALLMWLLAFDGTLDITDGLVFVTAGMVYMGLLMRTALRESAATREAFEARYDGAAVHHPRVHTIRSLAALLGGIAVIVCGADIFVDATVRLARIWGVSDAFIGLTVVAIGTSSPELVTTVVSTVRGQRDIAVGNLLGSSIFNIVFILGVTCLVPRAGLPVTPDLLHVDIPVMAAVAALCVPVFFTGKRVSRLEAALFVSGYCGYLAYLIVTRT